ncbi:MAG: hypothetical protein U0169_03590 [Polyangiaceae bacterium]
MAAFLAACSSASTSGADSGTTTPEADSGMSEDAMAHGDATKPTNDAGPADSAVSADGGSTTTPVAPTLTSATIPTHGTVSLTWTLPSGGCTTIDVLRKKDQGTYAKTTSVTGQATSTQDMPGHASGTYCYTLVCQKDGASSEPSNEKCATQ